MLPRDKDILRMLCDEVLPWMIAGRRARRRWFVTLATAYAYGGAIATGLAGLGIGTRLIASVKGTLPNGQNAVDVLSQALPGIWLYIGIAALVLWVVVGVVVQQQNVTDRALFARDCSKTMQKLYADLYDALEEPRPLPLIAPIKQAVRRARSEAIDKNVWPYNPPQPRYSDIATELHRQIEDIRGRFTARWVEVVGPAEQAPPAGE